MEQMSRQVARYMARKAAKFEAAKAKADARKSAQRALLERQTEREKAGFYGRPVAESISPSRSRVTKRKVQKGKAFGRIIKTITGSRREAQCHATKGWRSFRRATCEALSAAGIDGFQPSDFDAHKEVEAR